MPSRMEEQQQQPRRKDAEAGTRQQQQQRLDLGQASPPTASENAQATIIECRKKNSKREAIVTHRFRKGRLLGKGGFAHCYKVTCVETGRPYAMKIVPKSTLLKSRARQKLQTEIKIHRTLQHPRVVRFEMFFEDRENVYILLELCTNHSLSELIRKKKRFTEDESRRYMLQILEATSYLHRHQIIHRDLKLGNVFLDRDWNIKMGDFGLATKLVQDSERKRTICGTPNYIAPEILEGKTGHSYQVDLWSAGVILYTMLVGRPPYESTDVKSTYRRILANVYAFPDSVPLSDNAKDLVGRLLQVKPELRPSLDEILNHPFLRNGGPRQRFSTSHGLRASSNSASPPPSTVTGGGDGGGGGASSSTASRLGPQKHSTPERWAAGGFGRPPLKTRSSNVEPEAEGEVPAEGAARSAKPRAGASAAIGKADGGGPRDVLGERHAPNGHPVGVKRCAAGPSSSRPIVPRNHATKGFSVYCDVKVTAGGGGSGSRGRGVGAGTGGVGGAQSSSSSGSKRDSPVAGGGSRRSAAAGGVEAAAKSPGDKENDPRSAFGGGPGGVRVPVNGPVSRRTVARSVSSVGPYAREATSGGRVRTEGNGSDSVGGTKVVAGTRKPGIIRRSASAVGTQVERRPVSASDGGDRGSREKAAAGKATSTAPGARTPRVRPSPSRGAASSPATVATYSPYRSPLLGHCSGGGGSGGGGGRVSTRVVTVGDGMTPRNQATNRGIAQQRLDFGSTPRSTGQRHSPAGSSGSSGSKPIRPARLGAAVSGAGSGGGSRGVSCPSNSDQVVADSSRGGRGEAAAAGAAGSAGDPVSGNLEGDTLENMYEILAKGFATGSTGPAATGSASRRSGAARGTRASAAAAAREAAAIVSEADTPAPTVWVTRYVDYSVKYGLGFLLSDGSAGVYFNDATKIVLEPAGVAFEYTERTRRSSPVMRGSGSSGAASAGDQPSCARHTLDEFPPDLQKKVTLLNHFRGYLHELVKKDTSGAAAGDSAPASEQEGGNGEAVSAAAFHGQQRKAGEPLTFLRKWMRTRNAILFRLSNGTVQVVFSDHTEILLSKEARVVTFVDKDGQRETQSLQRVLEDQRSDITKRVRYSNELIAQLLRRA